MNARPVPPAVAIAVVAASAMHAVLGWLWLGASTHEQGQARPAKAVTVRMLVESSPAPSARPDAVEVAMGSRVLSPPRPTPAVPPWRRAPPSAAGSGGALASPAPAAVRGATESNGTPSSQWPRGQRAAATAGVAPLPGSRPHSEQRAAAPVAAISASAGAHEGPADSAAPLDEDAEHRVAAAGLQADRAPSHAARGAAGVPGAPAAGEQGPPPLYPTRLPPAATLHYALRRGAAHGTATLTWQPPDAGGQYRLQLDGRAGGSPLLLLASHGGGDATGLAPVRFVERRARGSARAANFEREHGIVSFSGPSVVHPLDAAMQDPLSWMVQLAAIVAADPQRAQPGAVTRLRVAGTRGDVDWWDFVAVEADAATSGSAPRLPRWLREPRRRYDLRVEVWLDPARHHLPVGLRLGTWAADNVMELLLDESAAAPR